MWLWLWYDMSSDCLEIPEVTIKFILAEGGG